MNMHMFIVSFAILLNAFFQYGHSVGSSNSRIHHHGLEHLNPPQLLVWGRLTAGQLQLLFYKMWIQLKRYVLCLRFLTEFFQLLHFREPGGCRLHNNLFAQQPYEPSDGFFAVRTIWLSDGMTFEPVRLLSLLCKLFEKELDTCNNDEHF
ncbi:hypothetical protein K438DRAFT_1766205 [Mycena galopus ATCC 62051]|nr:hypothetical protein K438DRAFT_1766205 [Mycena galopus ATCC 62051]